MVVEGAGEVVRWWWRGRVRWWWRGRGEMWCWKGMWWRGIGEGVVEGEG